MSTHFGLFLKRNYIFAQEINDEHKGEEVESGKSGQEMLDEIALIGYALIVHESIKESEGDDWLFEVAEEFLDKAGNEVRIGDLLEIAEITAAEFLQSLLFLIDGYALPEDPFLE